MRCGTWIPIPLRVLGCCIPIIAVASILTSSTLQAGALIFHASEPGKQTLDQGEDGGNPFASALIELLERPSLLLSHLPTELKQLTVKKSKSFQSADVPTTASQGTFSIVPPKQGEVRIALVMVISDYTQSEGVQSLPGAKHDAQRIASALERAGFATELALNLGLHAMRERLADFRVRSMNSDTAVIYTTGHGVEVDGTVFLIPGDYPIQQRNAALVKRALPLPEIARSLAATQVNLVFYGGCRDNPLGQ
jgi:hypothetical protein